MLRRTSVAVCAALLRIFFRRIELIGRENIPPDGLVIFVLNHPSGLIDPLFVLCHSGRRVSFLAKEPLFRMPIVGTFVKAFDSLPVYRARDGADPKKNRDMLQAARNLLLAGNALALFPEGTSHSAPHLMPLRSGAARLALSTQAMSEHPVYLVPGGLYYEQKQTFRSRAVLTFGSPIKVDSVPVDDSFEPDVATAKQVTRQIQEGIEKVLPTAETADGLALSEAAERIFSAALAMSPEDCPASVELSRRQGFGTQPPTLAERVQRRALFIKAYQELVSERSDEVARIVREIEELQSSLAVYGLRVDAAPTEEKKVTKPFGWWRNLALVSLILPAVIGFVTFAPAYFTVRWIAMKYSAKETDITATVKLLAGALLFPLTWFVFTSTIAYIYSLVAGALVGLLLVCSAFSAVVARDIAGALSYRMHKRGLATGADLDWSQINAKRAHIAENSASLLIERVTQSGVETHEALP